MQKETESDKLREKLTQYFHLCDCQRKLKTIVLSLLEIKNKCICANVIGDPLVLTGAEILVLSMLEDKSTAVMHGINCEYPIINIDDPFWILIDKIKDNHNLTNH